VNLPTIIILLLSGEAQWEKIELKNQVQFENYRSVKILNLKESLGRFLTRRNVFIEPTRLGMI